MHITVRTLDGKALDVEINPSACVKDIRKFLTQQYGLGKCALYLQARQLSMKSSIAELSLTEGDQLTALTTCGAAAAAATASRQQAAAPQSPAQTAAATAPQLPPQQQSLLDTLLPGYASRPNPSPVKQKASAAAMRGTPAGAQQQLWQQRDIAGLPLVAAATAAGGRSHGNSGSSSGAGASEPEATAAAAVPELGALTGGGFILTEQQQRPPQGGGAVSAADGQLPTDNSSRQRQGRTLLQQHIMMQHDAKQQQVLAAQQRRREQEEQQQHEQKTSPGLCSSQAEAAGVLVLQDNERAEVQQQQHQQQRQQQSHTAGSGQSEIYGAPPAAPASSDLQHQLGPLPQQQQQPQQPQQQQPAVPAMQQLQQQQLPALCSFWFELQAGQQHPAAFTRPQQDKLAALPMPHVVRQLLLLHCHLESCYSFLLQQHIVPRWGRLADMMLKLFPQDQFSLHHVLLLAQLAPQAVLLLQPPDSAQQHLHHHHHHQQQQQCEDPWQQQDPWKNEQRVSGSYPVHDKPWAAALTAEELAALQQQLQTAAQEQDQQCAGSSEHQAAHAHGAAVDQVGCGSVGAGQAAAAQELAGAAQVAQQQQPQVLLPAAAAGADFDVWELRVLLVDPGPGRRSSGKVAQRSQAEDTDEAANPGAATRAAAAADRAEEDVTKASSDADPAGNTATQEGAVAALQSTRNRSRRGKPQQQQQQQDSLFCPPTARYGSGGKAASARRQRWMASRLAAAVWLVHRQFLLQLSQQQPHQQQQWRRLPRQVEQAAAAAGHVAAGAPECGLQPEQATVTSAKPAAAGVAGGSVLRRQKRSRSATAAAALQQAKDGVIQQQQQQQREDDDVAASNGQAQAAASGRQAKRMRCHAELHAHVAAAPAAAAATDGREGVRRSQRLKANAGSSRAAGQQQQQRSDSGQSLLPSDNSVSDNALEYAPDEDLQGASDSDHRAHLAAGTAAGMRRRRKSAAHAMEQRKPRRGGRRGPLKLTGVASDPAAGNAAGAAGDSSGDGSAWDAAASRNWHPHFDEQQVTLHDMAAAVAGYQAWLQQQHLAHNQLQHCSQEQQHQEQGSAGFGPQVLVARPTRTMARHKPCTGCEELRPEQFLQHLKSLSWYQGQVVHVQPSPARQARHLLPSLPLAPSTQAALAARGIQQLFVHQAAAVDALCVKGKHVVVATSTASGKSLCYNVPMLEALAADRTACGLFMFPTKALAQDQLRVLRQLVADAFGDAAPCVEVYDGDTPQHERPSIRSRAQLLISNPDMLHQSILPCHANFARLLEKLTYVVVDEGHAYRGVFGCHAALVLRRLRRLCERVYGSRPLFVVTSATIANPLNHAALLLGVGADELLLVDEDGSPHGPKSFVLWNPPLTAEAQQAVAAGGGDVVMTRTELRGGSAKLKKEIARTLARESNAARRRGVALNAAAGVTEAEWAAAVKLGHASAAAKAVLFPTKHSNLGMALAASVEGAAAAAVAAAGAGLEVAAESAATKHKHKEQQQPPLPPPPQQQQSDQELAVDVTFAAAAAAGPRHAVGPESAGETDKQQQQQQVLSAQAATPGPAQHLSHKVHRVAQAALAAVEAAANPIRLDKSGRGTKRQTRRSSDFRPGLTPAAAQSARDNSRVTSNNSEASASTAAGAGAAAAAARGVGDQLQQQIEETLPPRGSFKERYGAAGTPLDQRRESPIVEMSLLLTEAVMHGLRTIAFCKSRKLCELVAAYTRENLRSAAPQKSGLVKVYRAGYSPAERRQLEADLHSGALTAVAATNALELGIDVGSLDLTLHLGFPGSVASLWQQAGRAGRRSQTSLSLYVAFDGPLDQHFMNHPQELFQRPIECVQLDPCNAIVLNSHLVCAAKELPLLPSIDGPLFGQQQLTTAAQQLQAAALLGHHPRDPVTSEALHYIGRVVNPAADISLRTIDPERFIIYNTADNCVLEEIEANMAFYEIYDGAIYLYQGRTYICTALSLETRVAQVRPVDVRWYTKVRDYTDIHVTGGRVAYPTAHAALAAIAARRARSSTTVTTGANAADKAAGFGEDEKPLQAAGAAAGAELKCEVDTAAAARMAVAAAGAANQAVGSTPCVKSEQGSGALPASAAVVPAEAPHVHTGDANSCGCCQQPAPVQLQDVAGAASGTCTAVAAAAAASGHAVPSGSAAAADVSLAVDSDISSAVCESCVITVRFMGYYRVHQGSGQVFDAIDLFLPDTQFETQACYMRLPLSARRACDAASVPFREAVHAASHALLNVLPLYMVCNSNDMGTECDNPYDTRFRPERLLLYDKHPGGIGLAAQATPLFTELLQRALDLVQRCPCAYVKGCPCCVQHLDCKNYNAVLHKQGAVLVLQEALKQEVAFAQAHAAA